MPSNSPSDAYCWNTWPSTPYGPSVPTDTPGATIVTLLPSRPNIGFFTHRVGSGSAASSRAAGNRFGCPGNSSHRIGRIALFDSTIFHAGSSHCVVIAGSSGAAVVDDQALPRVQLEQALDRAVLEIDERAPRAVPADVLHRDPDRLRCRPARRCRAGTRSSSRPRRRRRSRSAACGPTYGASSRHASISRSWIELNWSLPGKQSSSHVHWMTAPSSRLVGVSALYSSSFGTPSPNARSMRP